MGKSLHNFLKDRAKFSPKKKRTPIIERQQTGMVFCKLHDGHKNRRCIGPGCKHFDAKFGAQRSSHAHARWARLWARLADAQLTAPIDGPVAPLPSPVTVIFASRL